MEKITFRMKNSLKLIIFDSNMNDLKNISVIKRLMRKFYNLIKILTNVDREKSSSEIEDDE